MNRQSEKMFEIAISHLSHMSEISPEAEVALVNEIKRIKEGKAPKKNEAAADAVKEEKK